MATLSLNGSGVVCTEELRSNTVDVVRLTARNTACFLEIRLGLGQSCCKALALTSERSREDAVGVVGERRTRRQSLGRVQGDLTEAEEVCRLLRRDAGDWTGTRRNEGAHELVLV